MIAGNLIVGVGGAMVSALGALVIGKPLLTVAGCYVAGGSLSMVLSVTAGLCLRHSEPSRSL